MGGSRMNLIWDRFLSIAIRSSFPDDRTRDMLPCFSNFDISDGRGRNIEGYCYFWISSLIFFDCFDGFVRQFRACMSFAVTMSVLLATIILIILLCAKKKMIRINTRTTITFMKDIHSRWNFTPIDHPRSPMSPDRLMPIADLGVTIGSRGCYPKPASTHGFWYKRIFKSNLKRTLIIVSSVYSEFVGFVENCDKAFSNRFNNFIHGSSRVQFTKKFLFFFCPQFPWHYVSPFLFYPTNMHLRKIFVKRERREITWN
jgi:hypothetical protein